MQYEVMINHKTTRFFQYAFNLPRCLIWRCFLRKRVICLIFLIICFGVLVVVYITLESYRKCSFLEVEEAVLTLCDKYQNREALGNLCADLCELNTLQPNNCLPNHLGKDVVFQAMYYNEPVVIKSSKLNVEDFDQIYYTNADGNREHPSINMFYSMIANTIHSELNLNITHLNDAFLDVLSKLWTRNMKNFPFLPASFQNTAMSNIWFLIQQTEYLLMKYYEDVGVFPRILGTCGPMYVVEFIQPLDNYFSMFYPSWREDFWKRAKLALNLLNFLEETEKNFPFLHFCDIKVGHFGLDGNGDVKLLDMDMVFFEPALIKNIVAIQNCSRNQDCSFIDCRAVCEVKTRKCQPKVTNNNFLRACKNILSGRVIHSYFGLLSSPPLHLHKKIQPLLQKCSENIDDKSSHIVASQLKQLLESIVEDE